MRVIKVDNENARMLIEQYTKQYCQPDAIQFVVDGIGNWIMSLENLENLKFKNPDNDTLQQFLQANNVLTPITSILDVVTAFGEEIEYVPVIE